MQEVSIYKNITDVQGEETSLQAILHAIKNGRWKEQITKLRNIKDEKEQKAYKNTLPCFTGSGVFSSRKSEGLTTHSNIMILDFDLKDNPILLEQFNEIRQKLIAAKHIAFLFLSCRGNGFAVGIKIEGARHTESFRYLEKYYREKHGLTIDKGCKDVTRLRFISYDPDLYLNESAETVIVPPDFLNETKHTPRISTNENNHELMREILASGKLLGKDDYDTWLRICFALVSEFGESGRRYFHELSRVSPKYDQAECDRKYDNCLKTNNGEITFGSIIKMAGEAGLLNPELRKIYKQYKNIRDGVTEVTVVPEKIIQICEFPLDVFPDKLREFMCKISTAIDISPEVVGTIALAILSACVGNTVRVSPKKEFFVALFGWASIVLPSGTGKTHVQQLLLKPIKKMQSQAYLRYKELMQEYEIKMNIYKKDKNPTAETPEMPKMEEFYVSDSTVEALADVFEHQPRGILNSQDELSGLILGLNQYKAQGNDRQHYLDLFNCNSWKINRKGKSRFIPNVGMGIIGGIQPLVLTQVFRDDSFHDGFIQRFIFVCPDSRPLRFSRDCVGEEDLVYWEDLLYWCFGIPLEMNESGFVKNQVLTLSDRALDLWEHFYNEYGQLASILPAKFSGFIPKLFLYSLKFAGLLHIIEGFSKKDISQTISEKTIQDAIVLTKYYLGQANKVWQLYGKEEDIPEYHKRIVGVLISLQGDVFNCRIRLSKVVDGYNRGLPIHAHLTPEKMGKILNDELGLMTQKSTGNHSYLVWEDEKIKNLHERTVTTVTTVTMPTEKNQNRVTEVTEVTDDSKEEPTFQECEKSDFDVETDILEVVKNG